MKYIKIITELYCFTDNTYHCISVTLVHLCYLCYLNPLCEYLFFNFKAKKFQCLVLKCSINKKVTYLILGQIYKYYRDLDLGGMSLGLAHDN